MEHYPILKDLIVVFVASGLVVALFHRLRLPALVGLLVAGLIVGPYGLALVAEIEQVQLLAEVGVVVLLFTVGLEVSLSRVVSMWGVMLGVGLPQVSLCIGVVALATYWAFDAIGPAIFAGMLVAMSSTAVVLKVLTDRGELGTPQGRLAVAILLLQDLLVTVFMLAIPLLAPRAEGGSSMLLDVAKGVGVVVGVLVGSRYLVTPLLSWVVRTRNRELFLIFVSLLCLGTAALTASVGLSLALGAFLAGLVLSESEYAHQMFAEVMPFRDTLSSLFFVSVGMLLDLHFAVTHLPILMAVVMAVLILKAGASALPTLMVGYPLRIAILTGATLFQVGEFSFVMASRGREVGLLSDTNYQLFLAAAVLTMLMTPFAIGGGPRLAEAMTSRAKLGRRFGGRRPGEASPAPDLEDHVIIVGFGLGGRNLARVLRSVDIPYVILELNPESVRRSHAEGEPIHFGDSTRASVLEHVGVQKARAMVVVISDPAATRRTVRIARELAPRLHIVVRSRFAAEVDELKALGADEIIPEDFVTSVEIFTRVLREYQIPRNQIIDLIDRIRSDQYEALRGLRPAKLNLLQLELSERAELESCQVPEGSPSAGRSLGELHLRAETGATLLAVRRAGKLLTNPDADLRLEPGDVAILFGDREQVARASALLDPATFGAVVATQTAPGATP